MPRSFITLACPKCRNQMRAAREYIGRKGRCAKCGSLIEIQENNVGDLEDGRDTVMLMSTDSGRNGNSAKPQPADHEPDDVEGTIYRDEEISAVVEEPAVPEAPAEDNSLDEFSLDVEAATVDQRPNQASRVQAYDSSSRAMPNQLGDYEVIRTIGQGGMGLVYLGRHVHLDRKVAIKVIPGVMFRSKESINRLLREARIGAQLRHPNICQTLDARQEDGEFFFVMEFLEGATLHELSHDGPLPIGNSCHLALQLFQVLKYLSENNVVHRDIKPSNLMVVEGGQLKLLDLGLAKGMVDAELSLLTQTGQTVGTPAFMAPEQVTNARAVTSKADLYSAGMTLYRILTGRLPFEGKGIHEVLLQVLNGQPIDPREFRPDLPDPLAELILKLLAKHPDIRPSHEEAIAVVSSLDLASHEQAAATKSAVAVPAEPPESLNTVFFESMMEGLERVAEHVKDEDADDLLPLLPKVRGVAYLGDFKVIKRIGPRASINTYLGEMPLGRVRCVIRVLPPMFGSLAERFDELLDEQGRLMQASMKSSHLTSLMYIGKAKLAAGAFREIYFTIENFVPGISLDEMITAGERLGLREARRCLVQAAQGLGALHQEQILHGNLHPGKFLYDPEARELCIADLTRAAVLDAGDVVPTPTDEDPLLATLTRGDLPGRRWHSDHAYLRRQYLAPELLDHKDESGKNAAGSLASEQYALGIIFVEAMSGSYLPTHDRDLRQLRLAWAEIEDRLEQISHESMAFAHVLRKLVKPNPGSRFTDFIELRRRLKKRDTAKPARRRKGSQRGWGGRRPPRDSGFAETNVPDEGRYGRARPGQYDVFISYRRDGGAEIGQALKERLKNHDLQAFLDVDGLMSGEFDKALLRHIENTDNVVVILTKGCLDRCNDRKDWLRREIAHAIRCRCNIIPLLASGFEMPDPLSLPYDLRQLPKFSGISYEHAHFDSVVTQLLQYIGK